MTGVVQGVFDRNCLVCDQTLARYVATQDVWCAWKDEKIVVHVTMQNNSVEHLTVNWHPSYTIAGGGEHGTGLTASQSDGFEAGEYRSLLAEQEPEGVVSGSTLQACTPSFSIIESG